MKKILLSFTISFLSMQMRAQTIPNQGMETWASPSFLELIAVPYGCSSGCSYMEPTNWATSNILSRDLSNFLPGYVPSPVSVKRVTSAFAGSYAAEITTVKLGTNPLVGTAFEALMPDTVGIMFIGGYDVAAALGGNFADAITIGKPFNKRAEYVNYYFKYLPVGNDTGYVSVLLTKYNSSTGLRDTIGFGLKQVYGNVSTYAKDSVKLTMSTTICANPDTIVMFCSSSGLILPQLGTKLYVDAFTYTVEPPKTSVITGPSIVCPNLTGVNYSVVKNNCSSYAWTVPAGAAIASGMGTNSIIVNFGASGGTISVIETNLNGIIGTAVDTVITVSNAPPVTSAITGTTPVCLNQVNGIYSVNPLSGSTYAWTLPSGATISSGLNSNSIKVSWGANSGTITVVETSSCGGVGNPVNFTVTNIPTPVTSTITGQTDYCANASLAPYFVSFHLGNSYSWTVPSDASIVTGANMALMTVNFGITSGTITLTETNSCGVSGTVQSLTINITNALAPTVLTPVNYCKGATASALTATGSGLKWYTTSAGGIGVASVTPSTANFGTVNYYVSQTINGCESPRTNLKVVTGCQDIKDETNKNSFSFFPNPAGDEITFINKSNSNRIVLIFDLQGRLIVEQAINPGEEKMNVSKMPQGLYELQEVDANRKVLSTNKLSIIK